MTNPITRLGLCAALAAGMLTAAPMAQAAAPAHDPAAYPGLVPEGANVMFVYANAVPGQEAEFNTWYDEHTQAIMKLPGFVRCQRFKMQPRKGKPDPAYAYVILYEFNGDPDTVISALGPAVKEGRLKAPDARYVLKVESSVYKAMQPGFLGSDAK